MPFSLKMNRSRDQTGRLLSAILCDVRAIYILPKRVGFFLGALLIIVLPACHDVDRADPVRRPASVAFIGWENEASRRQFELLKAQFPLEIRSPQSIAVDLSFFAAAVADYDDAEMAVHRAISSNPTVLVTMSSGLAVEVKRQANHIPIVFSVSIDPTELGMTDNLTRPNSNATGITMMDISHGRRLQLLHWGYPSIKAIGILVDPTFLSANPELVKLSDTASALGLTLSYFTVSSNAEVARVFQSRKAAAMNAWYFPDVFPMIQFRDEILKQMRGNPRPAIYATYGIAQEGATLEYARASNNQASIKLARIIRQLVAGTSVADIPIEPLTEYKLLANADALKCGPNRVSAHLARLVDGYVRSARPATACRQSNLTSAGSVIVRGVAD